MQGIESINTRISSVIDFWRNRRLIERIRSKKLTYLTKQRLGCISDTVKEIEAQNLDGVFIEAGCALGGSTVLIASTKSKERSLFVYDVFEMIPPPTSADTPDAQERYKVIESGESTGIRGDEYYGYQENLLDVVVKNMEDFGIDRELDSVSLVKGLVQNTMDLTEPVAFAHVDVDWYEPVMHCLETIGPNLVTGGSIILDDYHYYGGCRKAVDQYLLTIKDQYTLDDSAGSLKLTRV